MTELLFPIETGFPPGAVGGPIQAQLPRKSFGGIFLVGEAPGADEIREGRPFVGKAGRLLDRALQAANIDRDTCIVANPIRFRPEKNRISAFFCSERQAAGRNIEIDKTLSPYGTGYCIKPYDDDIRHLWSLIDDYQPRIVVALGNTALWALSARNGGILKLAGSFVGGRREKTEILATFHPAYVMRKNPKGEGEIFDRFVDHLKIAAGCAATEKG